MKYDFCCQGCQFVWEIEKKMSDPGPSKCPECGSKDIERHYGSSDSPPILYANRPPWTYKECLKYKDCKFNDGPRTKIDPNKHGDLGAWNSPGLIVQPNASDMSKVKK